MTQFERESLVERYVSGAMSAAEEGDFFIHVAVDEELQRLLKAYRLMSDAIRADGETAVPRQARYRAHVFGMLAASPVAAGSIAGGVTQGTGASGTAGGFASAASAGAAGGAAGSAGAAAGGFGLAKILMAAAVGVSIAGGTVVYIASDSDAKIVVPAVGTERLEPPQLPARSGSSATGPATVAPDPQARPTRDAEATPSEAHEESGRNTETARARRHSAAGSETATGTNAAAAPQTPSTSRRGGTPIRLGTQTRTNPVEITVDTTGGK